MGRYSLQHLQKSARCTSDMCLKNHLMLDHWPQSSHCFRTFPDLTRPALSSSTPLGSEGDKSGWDPLLFELWLWLLMLLLLWWWLLLTYFALLAVSYVAPRGKSSSGPPLIGCCCCWCRWSCCSCCCWRGCCCWFCWFCCCCCWTGMGWKVAMWNSMPGRDSLTYKTLFTVENLNAGLVWILNGQKRLVCKWFRFQMDLKSGSRTIWNPD